MVKRRPRAKAPAPSIPTPTPRPSTRLWWAALAAAIVLAIVAGVLLLGGRPRNDADARSALLRRSPAPRDLNVVVLTLDTTRADRLHCYGFKDVETPRIDALASRGVLFEQATSTVPLTFPSHASIFTGLLPPHHGVRDNGGFFLDDSKTTMAERFKAAGYATGAFIGAWVLEAKWGLSQGFDTYADQFELSKYQVLSLGTVQKKGDEVMDQALAWLEGVKSRKFFAWVHLYDPHAPYDPPEPFRSRYASQRYLGEIAYTDQVVGRLTGWLDAQGLTGRTLIVLTADHGEGLGEHNETAHAYFLYDSTTHVPLIIATPWGDTGKSRAQVTSVDILPTVLDLAGLPQQEGIDGRSLARVVLDPGADPGQVAYSETYFPRYHFGWQHLRSLRDGRYKFIEAPEPELYDLAKDPGELTNVYKAFSKTADAMRVAMNGLTKDEKKPAPEREKLDPETLQRLAALGYVGNVSDVDPDAVLPDPKSKAHVFEMMSQAKDAAQEDHLEEAVATMRKVLAEEPQIVDAHLTLGNWLSKLHRTEEAAAEFKATLALKPDNEIAMVNLANVYRGQGKSDAALQGYKTALTLDPKSPQTWFQLATLYLDLGRVDDAEATFRQAVEKNPKMGAGYNGLGVIAFKRGKMEEAERLVRKGLELEARVRTGRYNLARILEARGDTAAAESLYRAELDTYPDHGRARFNLAQMLREKGDREGYLRELQQGVEKAPEFGPCYFFLAREKLEGGRLEEAQDLARRGLEADSYSEVAPLGHYVLADVYNRQGQPSKAQDELGKARHLEAELRRAPQPPI
jgi:arylsulfatase A-like enzyme/Tfp pilus assembly protein PilF